MLALKITAWTAQCVFVGVAAILFLPIVIYGPLWVIPFLVLTGIVALALFVLVKLSDDDATRLGL